MPPIYEDMVTDQSESILGGLVPLLLVEPLERWLCTHFQSLSNFCQTRVSGIVTELATPSLYVQWCVCVCVCIHQCMHYKPWASKKSIFIIFAGVWILTLGRKLYPCTNTQIIQSIGWPRGGISGWSQYAHVQWRVYQQNSWEESQLHCESCGVLREDEHYILQRQFNTSVKLVATCLVWVTPKWSRDLYSDRNKEDYSLREGRGEGGRGDLHSGKCHTHSQENKYGIF